MQRFLKQYTVVTGTSRNISIPFCILPFAIQRAPTACDVHLFSQVTSCCWILKQSEVIISFAWLGNSKFGLCCQILCIDDITEDALWTIPFVIVYCRARLSHARFYLHHVRCFQKLNVIMSAYALPNFFPVASLVCTTTVDSLHSFSVVPNNGVSATPSQYDILQSRSRSSASAAPTSCVKVTNARIDLIKLTHAFGKQNVGRNTHGSTAFRNKHHSGSKSEDSCPQEEAMEFHLVLSGHQQQAVVRNLTQLRQLRRDLGREKQEEAFAYEAMPHWEKHHHHHTRGRLDKHLQAISLIPELPRWNDESTSTGFALLYGILDGYARALEDWFSRVLRQFPSVESSWSLRSFFLNDDPSFSDIESGDNLNCIFQTHSHLFSIEESPTDCSSTLDEAENNN